MTLIQSQKSYSEKKRVYAGFCAKTKCGAIMLCVSQNHRKLFGFLTVMMMTKKSALKRFIHFESCLSECYGFAERERVKPVAFILLTIKSNRFISFRLNWNRSYLYAIERINRF